MNKLAKPVGAVWCCGVAPEFGHHNHHSYNGRKDLSGYGFWCPKCLKVVSVLGGASFALQNWNASFCDPWGTVVKYGDNTKSGCEPPLPAPYTDWLFGTLQALSVVTTQPFGASFSNPLYRYDAVLFKTSRKFPELLFGDSEYECSINAARTLPDLEIVHPEYGKPVVIPLKVLLKNGHTNAHVARVLSSSGCYYTLCLNSANIRYNIKLRAALQEAGYPCVDGECD